MSDKMSDKDKRSQRYEKLTAEQRQALRNRVSGTAHSYFTLNGLPRTYPLPASYFQESLWLQQEFETKSVAYNLPVAFRLIGNLNKEALEWTLNQLVKRHEILRTTFSMQQGQLIQTIAIELNLSLPLIDISTHEVEERKVKLDQLIKIEAETQFNLASGPLLQSKLIRLSKSEHIVSLCMHHIISDGFSKQIIATELAAYYTAFINNNNPLPQLPLQYADFAIWQRNQLTEGKFQSQMDYWLQQLANLPSSLNLPVDRAYQSERNISGNSVAFTLDKTLYTSVKEFCRDEGVSLFMFLISIFKVLLFRYTAQEDILIGTPISNRKYKELEQIIGFFTNTLVLRSTPKKNKTFKDFLQEIKHTALEAYQNQDLPYEKLVSTLQPERFSNQSSLFQSLFIFQKVEQSNFNLHDLSVSHYYAKDSGAKFDLSFVSFDNNNTIEFYIEYATDIFNHKTIERMGKHFIELVKYSIKNPTEQLQYMPLLTKAERDQHLINASGKVKDLTDNILIHQLFEAQAIKTPLNTAIICGSNSLKFAELNDKANQLAHYLVEKNNLKVGSLVGIYLDRSLDMIIALLAVLKAGFAYIPLDPGYPNARLSYIMEDANLDIVITERKFFQQLSKLSQQSTKLNSINLDNVLPKITNYSTQNLSLTINANQLAYVIYTSGSTGQPKGVMIEHRHVQNFMQGMDDEIGSTAGTWLAATSISFDISVLELFWTLTRGFKVILTETVTNFSTVSNQTESAKIDFSLFYFSSVDGHQKNKYQMLLEGAKFADSHDFKAIWTPERHFSKFGGLYPNPSVISAALAMVTKQIKLRAGSCVIPLHHTARVAEEWSVVDNLSSGRVGISFASGWQPNDFIFAPHLYESRQEVMLQEIEKVRALWRGDTLTFTATNNRNVETKIYPRPLQPELPVWLTSSGNPETFRKAGEIGANLLTHLLGQSIEELAEKIQIYRESFRRHHPDIEDGTVTLMIHTFVAHDEDFVLQQVKEPLKKYLADSIGLLKPFAEASGKDIHNISNDDMQAVLEHAFKRYYETSGLFGTPSSCLQKVKQIAAIDVNELACLIDFGIPEETVLENLIYLNKLKENSKIQSTTLLDEIPELMRRHNVTHFQCTPAVITLLSENAKAREQIQSLSHLLIGGEDCPLPLINKLTQLVKGDVFNMYGPTETTVWSLVEKFSRETNIVSIGKPITNTKAYILDSSHQLLPQGIVGELYIGGFSVARGYLNQDKLTDSKFIELQLNDQHPERLYKTGDLAKYLPQGSIKYVGRNDNQIKIRGFRVELEEIERVAVKNPSILDSVAIVHEEETQGKQIILYFNLNNEVTDYDKINSEENLKQLLIKLLPNYMIPTHVILLDKFPLTSNGKIDRLQLSIQAKSLKTKVLNKTYNAPVLAEEIILTHIWQNLLNVKNIGVHDNFFNLGGNSILAIEMLSRAKEANIYLSPRLLFQYPTIAELVSGERSETSPKLQNTNELILDVQMDDVKTTLRKKSGNIKNILLTGSTGFLGAFLLRDLLDSFSAKIYCIARATDANQVMLKIQQNLSQYKIWQEHYLDRIIPIIGDVSRERLGLESILYEKLSIEIDTIIHSAANTNLVQSYEQLKSTNVYGTQQILKFATTSTIKPLHYISSLKIFSTENSHQPHGEDDDLRHGQSLSGGYTQSKWVADQILLEAQKKGLPVNIYRPGRVSGCSVTGAWNTKDFACRMIKGFMQLGFAPKTNAKIDLTPVDYVSSAIAHIIKQELIGKTFHLKQPTLVSINEIIQTIRKMNYEIHEIPYAQWYEIFINSLQKDENELHSLIGLFDSNPSFDPWQGEELLVNCNNAIHALSRTTMADLPSSKELLNTYFNYLFETGYLPKPLQKTIAEN